MVFFSFSLLLFNFASVVSNLVIFLLLFSLFFSLLFISLFFNFSSGVFSFELIDSFALFLYCFDLNLISLILIVILPIFTISPGFNLYLFILGSILLGFKRKKQGFGIYSLLFLNIFFYRNSFLF